MLQAVLFPIVLEDALSSFTSCLHWCSVLVICGVVEEMGILQFVLQSRLHRLHFLRLSASHCMLRGRCIWSFVHTCTYAVTASEFYPI